MLSDWKDPPPSCGSPRRHQFFQKAVWKCFTEKMIFFFRGDINHAIKHGEKLASNIFKGRAVGLL